MSLSRGKYFLHMMQLEGYSNKKYIDWVKENNSKIFSNYDILFQNLILICVFLFVICLNSEILTILVYISIFIIYFFMTLYAYSNERHYKKPLVFTKRAFRLFSIKIFFTLLIFFIACLFVHLVFGDILSNFPIVAFILSIAYFYDAYIMVVVNYISMPVEKSINKYYYNLASSKIRKKTKLHVVGITGSYGKTSAKFITATILSEKYKVLKTPESYNTPMGISKVINNDLDDTYQVFIAELGATKKGDIKEVAHLTNPQIGILTSIGPCHLKTFGSIKNVMDTKYELIEKLPLNGIAIFNCDNTYVYQLSEKTGIRKILYGIDNSSVAEVYAKEIDVSENGSSFTLCIRNIGSIKCNTKLLGKHNILNILAGASVAHVLGLNLTQIKSGIEKICPVKHRLELINSNFGVLVIDDAFNSNPDGASCALDVLSQFKDKRKIIVTPGMVELGSIENFENEKFGEKISSICDIVILVGKKRTQYIKRGLENTKFNIENLYVVNSLNEATEILKTITKNGDIVLFENDLPDTYDEN